MEILDGLTERKIFKMNSNHSVEKMDIVAIEEPMEIAIKYIEKDHTNLKTISITMRTPGHDKYLVLGFLFSEGIIDSVSDIHDIQFKFSCTPEETIEQTVVVHIKPHLIHRVKDLNRHFYTSSSCGVCGKTTIDLAVTHCHFLLKSLEKQISLDTIYKLPSLLKSNQKLQVALHGHTDNIGNPSDNLVLSNNRAKAVLDYLASNGIEKSRMSFKGFGETKPIASNSTEVGRAKNRRTVFVVNSK